MAKTTTCVSCKRKNMSIAAAGECGRCYGRRRAGKDPLTNKPIATVAGAAEVGSVESVELLSIQKPAAPPQETALEPESSVRAACVAYMDAPPKPDRSRKPRPYPTPETITLPFTSLRDADLYGKLQTLAATHRRTLEDEIMFQLEDRVMQIEDVYLSILDK